MRGQHTGGLAPWQHQWFALAVLFVQIGARAEVLLVRGPEGTLRKCEAVAANWNQAIEDAGQTKFVGEVHFDEANPCGCHPYNSQQARGRLVLVDTSAACDDLVFTAWRAAEAGALGVIFFHHGAGLTGIALGNNRPPLVRAVMIERRHGEAVRNSLAHGILTAELETGLLISEDAYEEHFIFRADEAASTRSVNFLWHRRPEMVQGPTQRAPLSLQLAEQGLSAPTGWFSHPPPFVPLFNPSLVTLEDSSLLVTLRMSNGPGCPSVRRSHESSMDTRVFHNELVLAHVNARDLAVMGYVIVETPLLSCHFTKSTKLSGRQFLDAVHGPMDTRLVVGAEDELWVTFYAERNIMGSDEIVRGIHAAPLHVAWQPCSSSAGGGWALHQDAAVFHGPSCPWLGAGNGTIDESCQRSCDATPRCNAVSFAQGRCQLHTCHEKAETLPLVSWRAWFRTDPAQWHRTERTCDWLALGNGASLAKCREGCEAAGGCAAILFSRPRSACILQRCSGDASSERLVPSGWEAWRFGPRTQPLCLDRAWVEPSELISFPAADGVEKNWNLIHASRDRLLVEYHVDPHIVLEARLGRMAMGLQLESLWTLAVSRWPSAVLHGVTNVRGGYCCLRLPEAALHVARRGGMALPGGPLLLGCGHLQRIRTPFDQAPGDVDRFRRQAKSRAYHQFLYALRGEAPFDVVAVSPEWCITMSGHFSRHWQQVLNEGEEACEAIQFVAGIALRNPHEVVVAYGINDCEANLLVLPIMRVLAMLRPVQSELNVSLDSIDMI